MKLSDLAWLLLLFFPCTLPAQPSGAARDRAARLTEEYIQLSRLGPGYSRDLSEETLAQFSALFDRDAFLVWDLRRSLHDTLPPPLTVSEYLARVRRTYHPRQPVLDYGAPRITPGPGSRSAVVRLRKTNLVMDDRDNVLARVPVNIRMEIGLDRDQPVIRSITAEERRTPVRQLSLGAELIPWSRVHDRVLSRPEVILAPGVTTGNIIFSTGIRLQSSVLVDLDFSERNNGWIFITGLVCRRTELAAHLTGYERSYPDTVAAGAERLVCTTYERAAEVYEKITLTRIELPLWLKKQLNEWVYVRGGISIGYVSEESHIHYPFSRTGGGWVTDLNTSEQYYLDETHEMDAAEYGYFRNRQMCYPFNQEISHWVFSLQLATGLEKYFNRVGIGVEPTISFGGNPLSGNRSERPLNLSADPARGALYRSASLPAAELTAGLRLFVSYRFR